MKSFFDGESKDEALYDVWYRTDGSYHVSLQDFDMKKHFDINIIYENILHNDWWKYRVSVMAKDEHYAIKIAQDLWAEYKAKKEGIV